MNKKNLINGWIDDELLIEGKEETRLTRESFPNLITHMYVPNLNRTNEATEIIRGDR